MFCVFYVLLPRYCWVVLYFVCHGQILVHGPGKGKKSVVFSFFWLFACYACAHVYIYIWRVCVCVCLYLYLSVICICACVVWLHLLVFVFQSIFLVPLMAFLILFQWDKWVEKPNLKSFDCHPVCWSVWYHCQLSAVCKWMTVMVK